MRKEKNAEVAKVNGKNESSVCESAKKEKEIYANFASCKTSSCKS